jgi:hypothetical protein
MSLRKDWLSRQFVRVDADVRNWPESMKVEAGFATRDRAGEMSCASNEKAAIIESSPKEPAENS